MSEPTLVDLFDPALLEQMIEQGYIRRQVHQTLPLAILNYSELAQFERVWNPVTRQCRGLIYEVPTGRILARPFPKFFNHGEPGAPIDWDLDEQVVVTDKLDGSLGILYDDGDGGAIATRGSFTSDQAIHATALWKRRYAGRNPVPCFHTLLFEVIFPENRIVVDYRGLDDLVLLGGVELATGRTTGPWSWTEWTGRMVSIFPYATLAEALAAEPREGKEGLVVHFVGSDQRVKLKQADYVALHRIVTGLSTRTVWEHLAAGKPLTDLIEPLPDEFHAWVREVGADLTREVARIEDEVCGTHREILDLLPAEWTRKDYALIAKEQLHAAALFRHLDGRDFRDYAWKLVKPEREMAAPGAPVRDEAVA